MNPTPTLRQRQEAVANWNRENKVGCAVRVRKDDGSTIETRTYHQAEMLGGHTPVIWVEGISGAYALERCTPIQTDLPLS